MKKIVLLVSTIVLFFALTACVNLEPLPVDVDNYEAIQERGYIVVGLECNYAPFNWSVEKAQASDLALPQAGSSAYCDGYDVQVAQTIANELGVDLFVKAVDWDGLIPSLATNGSIDMIIAGMSPTAERAQTVAFSSEYYHSTHVVVLRSDSTYANVTSIDDFAGANVVAQMNTFYDELVDQMAGVNHLNPLGDVPTIVTGIKSNTYDLTILELPVAIAVTASNPELTYIAFQSGLGFSVTYEDSAVSIAVRQSDITLLAEINAILSTISSETRETWMVEAINRQPE
ncbi:MAG: ABC transporter substrate-binding protein [Tenericutes bacterium HGW-Tenericutes-1]|jgi:ABC-type amino acid transport substrate-binding protein|nr:MAG: ABC transporter substrate-binding protein [Tenericutes bacterium HGW-Tenericutes-1]